jgi:hypothetical protein
MMEDPKNTSFLVQSSFILDPSTRDWMYGCLHQIELHRKLRLDLEGFRTYIYDNISYVTDTLHHALPFDRTTPGPVGQAPKGPEKVHMGIQTTPSTGDTKVLATTSPIRPLRFQKAAKIRAAPY